MRQGEHGRLRAFCALVLAAVIGLSACAGPGDTASSPVSTASASVPASAVASPSASAVAGGVGDPTAGSAASPAQAPDSTVAAPPTSAVARDSAAGSPLVLPAADPVSLSVPAIGVTSPLSSLGRNADGTVQVPSLDDPNAGAGWFRDSPEPGSLGPAIILGHVDSREYGPGVFYDLKKLNPGDTIEITRSDATVAVFTIDSVQDVPKAQFPTQQVYGNLDHAGLRLITCGGVFDSEVRSYEDNIIAFATLTSSRPA